MLKIRSRNTRVTANQMSEPKRIALIPLAAAEAAQAPLPAKKDKKSPTKIVKTHRFTLTLPDSTEKSCPEFNFADLISALTVILKKLFLRFSTGCYSFVLSCCTEKSIGFSFSSFHSLSFNPRSPPSKLFLGLYIFLYVMFTILWWIQHLKKN